MDPELIARMVQDLLAQSDVTSVADPRERREPEPQGDIKNLLFNLLQGADPTMGLGSSLAGAIPDRPNLPLQIAAGLLTGGSLKSLFKGAAGMGRKAISAADEAFDLLLDRLGTSSTRTMTESRTARTLERLLPGESITSLVRGEEEMRDAALLQEVIDDRISREAVSLKPSVTQGAESGVSEAQAKLNELLGLPPGNAPKPVTRADFQVSERVEGAIDRLDRGGQVLNRKDADFQALVEQIISLFVDQKPKG
ncbi:hypothetical protein LCGC14_0759650 [marine sediment metagenome]|uniref:Uncharacterized protein n=1 Tax=marine sediment metagenome TaxID=412755 RepID=A0A0F9SLR8_9ZZZZ